jgi:hypothetical protein
MRRRWKLKPSPEELLMAARHEDDELSEALVDAVILGGAAGADSQLLGHGPSPGFMVVSRKPIAPLMPKIRRLACELAGTGYHNLARASEAPLDSFEEWSIEPERFFDLGERILVFVRFRAKGKGSGVPVEAPLAYLYTLRDGKVIEWGLFGDRSKALEAAGLRE